MKIFYNNIQQQQQQQQQQWIKVLLKKKKLNNFIFYSTSFKEELFIPTIQQKKLFQENGFLIIDSFLKKELVENLKNRLEPLFQGKFETGIYPDEWHWREGMSLPNITREICNAWKSDLTIASVVLSSYIGQIAALLGDWDGSRVAQDDIWMKPPEKGKEISYHQDCTYIPWPEITCWIALDNVNAETGTLEYVKGSHLWKKYKPKLDNENFHAPSQDYKKSLYLAAESEGITKEELEKLIVKVQIPAGGCSFHDGNLWHGSDINKSKSWRRNIAIHYIPSNSNFNGIHAGYIYGRYKKYNSDIMDESFFPIVIEKKLFVDYKLGLDKNWI